MPCVSFVRRTFFALYLLIFSYILPFFDGTAAVPRFSDCMVVQINCFCRHVLSTPCIRKNDFPLSHCSTGCCVYTCQLYSNAGALCAVALLELLKYCDKFFFFDSKNCRRDCITCFFEQHTSHGCSYAGVGIAGGTRGHRRWCCCHSTTVVAGSLPSSSFVFCSLPLPTSFLSTVPTL